MYKEAIWNRQGGHMGHPRENPRSLSSPKDEICPKITNLERFRDVWFGKFISWQYRTVRDIIRVIHAKTPGLYQVPMLRYAQKSLIWRGFVRFREIWYGKFISWQFRTIREVIWVIHAKTPCLYQVPKPRKSKMIRTDGPTDIRIYRAPMELKTSYPIKLVRVNLRADLQ